MSLFKFKSLLPKYDANNFFVYAGHVYKILEIKDSRIYYTWILSTNKLASATSMSLDYFHKGLTEKFYEIASQKHSTDTNIMQEVTLILKLHNEGAYENEVVLDEYSS